MLPISLVVSSILIFSNFAIKIQAYRAYEIVWLIVKYIVSLELEGVTLSLCKFAV